MVFYSTLVLVDLIETKLINNLDEGIYFYGCLYHCKSILYSPEFYFGIQDDFDQEFESFMVNKNNNKIES